MMVGREISEANCHMHYSVELLILFRILKQWVWVMAVHMLGNQDKFLNIQLKIQTFFSYLLGKEAGTYNGIDDTEKFTLEIELFAPMV